MVVESVAVVVILELVDALDVLDVAELEDMMVEELLALSVDELVVAVEVAVEAEVEAEVDSEVDRDVVCPDMVSLELVLLKVPVLVVEVDMPVFELEEVSEPLELLTVEVPDVGTLEVLVILSDEVVVKLGVVEEDDVVDTEPVLDSVEDIVLDDDDDVPLELLRSVLELVVVDVDVGVALVEAVVDADPEELVEPVRVPVLPEFKDV